MLFYPVSDVKLHLFPPFHREKGDSAWRQWFISFWPIDGNNGTIRSWKKHFIEYFSWIRVSCKSHHYQASTSHFAVCVFHLSDLFCLQNSKFFSETGVSGKITINGKNRSSNSKNFRNVSAYIHQDDALRPYLTVREAMTVAAHLKLGFKVTKEYKNQLVGHQRFKYDGKQKL